LRGNVARHPFNTSTTPGGVLSRQHTLLLFVFSTFSAAGPLIRGALAEEGALFRGAA
jgi:hypothetical protein